MIMHSRHRQAAYLLLLLALECCALLITAGSRVEAAEERVNSPSPAQESLYNVGSGPMETGTPCVPDWAIYPGNDPGSAFNFLYGVAAIADNNVWAAGYYYSDQAQASRTLIEHWDGVSWSAVPSPNQGAFDNVLSGVAALSAEDVWVVGNYFDSNGTARTLIEHWNGTAWSVVPSPNQGSGSNYLYNVAAISQNDVWAVGYYRDSNNRPRTLIEHWNGTAWFVVPSPNRGTFDNELRGVVATGTADVWAVGYSYDEAGSKYQTLVERWNGTAWSIVPSPNRGASSNYLLNVDAVAANDVWAVGHALNESNRLQTLTQHWDGTAWTIVPSPNQGSNYNLLRGISATSAGDIWTVGYYSLETGNTPRTLTLHWDGTAWSIVPSPNEGSSVNDLFDVVAMSGNRAWAVGQYDTGSMWRTLTMHYKQCGPNTTATPSSTRTSTASPPSATPTTPTSTGTAATSTRTRTSTVPPTGTITPTATATYTPTPGCGLAWRYVSSPNEGDSSNYLHDVAIISHDDIWAVGYYNKTEGSRTLTLHWDGTEWSTVFSPNTESYANGLFGVTALSSDDVWAVGEHGVVLYGGQGLILHWDGASWSIVPVPTPMSSLKDVTAMSGNDIWAVGGYGQTNTVHWDGAEWSIVASPNPGTDSSSLTGVSAIAPNDVWAVGVYYDGGCCAARTLTMHWDGVQWSTVSSPNLGGYASSLRAVYAVSSNDVWAVGDADQPSGSQHWTLIEHWDGTAWTIISSPNPGASHNFLRGVTAVSATDIWAVGEYTQGSGYDTLTLHWDGSAWSTVSSPNPGSTDNGLSGVAADSASNVWAVGYFYPGGTLTLEYSDPCAGSTPSPISTSTLTPISSATITSTSTSITTPTATVTSTPTEQVASPTPELTVTLSATAATSTGTPSGTAVPGGTITPGTPMPTACAIEFTDVPEGSTFYEFVRCIACRGIINGYTSGCETGVPCFKPGNLVTRGQLAKIVANAAGFTEPAGAQQFEDVPVGSTFFEYVWRLADRDIVSGYPCGGTGEPCGTGSLPYFRPNNNVTRGQISKIVSEGAALNQEPTGRQFEDVQEGSTFYVWIWRLVDEGVMNGYPCGGAGEPCNQPDNRPYFRPGANATRGQASKIVANTFFPECQPVRSR